IAEFIHKDIICRHGVPLEMTSDRGTEFVNQLIQELTRVYKINHIKTTAYHPQGNGQTERMNKTLKTTLAKVLEEYQHWDHYLPSVVYAMNTLKSESTQFSPFELVYGRKPRSLDARSSPEENSQPLEEIIWSRVHHDVARLHKIRTLATEHIRRA